MTRIRKIALAATVFVMLAVFAGCSKAQTTFNLGHLNITSHLLGFVAAEEGFFQEEGLNVTLVRLANSSELTAGLVSGKLDAAFIGVVGTVAQQAAGHDITVFGGAMTNGHTCVLKTKYIPVDWKEGDITVLKGRNIAVGTNSIQDYELQLLFKLNGIEIGEGPDKVNLVYFGGGTDIFAAFAGNEIDGFAAGSPYTSLAIKEGHTVVCFFNRMSVFENQPCCRQIALTSALKAKPDTYIAFERALIKAYKFSQENHTKTVEDVAKYVTVDKKDIEYEVYSGYSLSHPDPDKKATTILKKDLVEFGITKGADYDLEKLYNLDIYKEALAQIIEKNPNDSVYKSMEERFNSTN